MQRNAMQYKRIDKENEIATTVYRAKIPSANLIWCCWGSVCTFDIFFHTYGQIQCDTVRFRNHRRVYYDGWTFRHDHFTFAHENDVKSSIGSMVFLFVNPTTFLCPHTYGEWEREILWNVSRGYTKHLIEWYTHWTLFQFNVFVCLFIMRCSKCYYSVCVCIYIFQNGLIF